MHALIGHTGLIGSVLADNIQFDRTYNSSNIDQIKHCDFDTVYCAAPSGNRLLANKQPSWDSASTTQLIASLTLVRAQRLVLISSVDTVYAPESVYGSNRLALENFVLDRFAFCHVVRLCTLIHRSIGKNLLFDIKHRQYLDSVNSAMIRQYYPLSRLSTDIDTVIQHNLSTVNLVSEPVSDQEVMQKFCPDVTMTTVPVRPYDMRSQAPFGQYVLTKSQVFEHIAEYIND